MDENIMKFKASNNMEYKIEKIGNSKVYVKELVASQL